MVYRFYGQACSGHYMDESCHVWATICAKQCNKTLLHTHLFVQHMFLLESGLHNTVYMLVTYAGLCGSQHLAGPITQNFRGTAF